MTTEIWAAGGVIAVFILTNIGTALWLGGSLTTKVKLIGENTESLVGLVQDHNDRVIRLEESGSHREETAQTFRAESKRRFSAIETNIISIAKDIREVATRAPKG